MEAIKNTFVLVAPDCPVKAAVIPVTKRAAASVAVIQHECLTAQPYKLTLEDLYFEVHVRRAGLSQAEAKARAAEIRAALFAKPQACMRTSPLPKRYGWGVHYDEQGRLALYPMESKEYRRFAEGQVDGVKVVAALRSKA